MLLDWFTVVAQVLNFLILLMLLRRFLYKPILKAIAEREQRIKSQIEEARAQMAAAEQSAAAYEQKRRTIEDERSQLLRQAEAAAAAKRRALLEEARKDAEILRRELEHSIQEKQQHLSREINQRTQEEVLAIARKVMTDLASAELEGQIVQLFVRRLQQLKGAQRKELQQLLGASSAGITVKSAFELTADQRTQIEAMVARLAGEPVVCQFNVAPDKISGIELIAQGYKVSWTIADYLGSLERKLEALLDEELELQANPKNTANEIST